MPQKPSINPATWESHRAKLKNLYLDQDKNLGDVMKYMEENHHFVATKSQYEAIFKKWQYTKNLKPSQWQYVGNSIKKRKADGKESEVYHNGYLVAPKKLKKELGRNCDLPSWRPEVPCPQTPPGIEVRTPKADYHQQLTPTAGTPITLVGYGWSPAGDLPVFQFQRCLEQTIGDEISLTWMNRFARQPTGFTTSATTTPTTPTTLSSTANPLLATLLFRPPAGHEAPTFEVIHSHMEAVSSERTEGELVSNIQALLGPFNHQALLVFFKHAAYLASNNLLSRNQEDRLLQWIVENIAPPTLKMLFSVEMPTTQAFARTMFRSALLKKDVDAARTLLACGVDARPDASISAFRTPLELVASMGNLELASSLLEWGVGANHQSETALTRALCEAASMSDIDMVRLFLEKGAQGDLPGHSVLGYAVFGILKTWEHRSRLDRRYGGGSPHHDDTHLQILTVLLNSGADVEQRVGFIALNGTALQLAAKCGNVELARVLLERGADVRVDSGDGALRGTTALQIASAGSNHELAMEIALLLLGAGADINAPPHDNWNCNISVLSETVSSGNVHLARMMLDAGADVNSHGNICCTKTTAMYQAVQLKHNRLEMVLLLLDAGADVNAFTKCMNGQGETALVQATLQDDIDLVRLLLDKGADVNAPASTRSNAKAKCYPDCCVSYHPMTALQAASGFGSTEVVKILLHAGADVNAPSITPLTRAAGRSTSEIARTLLEAGADVRVDYGCPAIISALRTGNRELVQLLLAKGADVNKAWTLRDANHLSGSASPSAGDTPLSTAIIHGWKDIEVELMQAGAKIDTLPPTVLESAVRKDDIGGVSHLLGIVANINMVCTSGDVRWVRNALPLATMVAIKKPRRNHAMLHLLLRAGADVNGCCHISSWFDTTALIFATTLNHFELVKVLLEAGADANYFPPYLLNSPLVWPSKHDNNELVDFLRDAGVDVNVTTPRRTALQAAAESGHIKVVRLLLDGGADVNAPPAARSMGITALQGAAINGYLGIVRMLLEAGADPNGEAAEHRGRTALQGAAEHGRLDILQLLLNSGAEIRGWPARKAKRFAEREGHSVVAQILARRIEELGEVSSAEESIYEELLQDSDNWL